MLAACELETGNAPRRQALRELARFLMDHAAHRVRGMAELEPNGAGRRAEARSAEQDELFLVDDEQQGAAHTEQAPRLVAEVVDDHAAIRCDVHSRRELGEPGT